MSHIGPKGALVSHEGPYGTMQSLLGPHQAIKNRKSLKVAKKGAEW